MKYLIICLLFLTSCQSESKETEEVEKTEVKTHYEVYGEGTPILIINGGPGMSSEGFRPLAKELGKEFKAIIYDQRGTGHTHLKNLNENNVTLDLMIEDIENLRKELKIKKWVVLGHSFGGMLGSYYATKHPESIKGLILSASGGIDLQLFDVVDILGRLTPEERDSIKYYNQKMNHGDTSFATKIGRARNLAPAYLFKKEHANTISKRLTQSNFEINDLVFHNMEVIGFNCTEDLKSFDKPTLIIQGKEDIIPISLSLIAKTTIPNSEMKVIPECGHYPWLEQPKAYFRTIKEFVSSLQ